MIEIATGNRNYFVYFCTTGLMTLMISLFKNGGFVVPIPIIIPLYETRTDIDHFYRHKNCR